MSERGRCFSCGQLREDHQGRGATCDPKKVASRRRWLAAYLVWLAAWVATLPLTTRGDTISAVTIASLFVCGLVLWFMLPTPDSEVQEP